MSKANQLLPIHFVQYFFYVLIISLLLFICDYANGILKHNTNLETRTEQDIQLLEDLLSFEKEHAKIEFDKMNNIQHLEEFELEELEELKTKK